MTKEKPQTTKNNTAQKNLTERLERKETVRGTALTITGGFLWGIAGVFGKYTFEYKGVTATWIVNVRLIIAGIILLTRAYMVQKDGIFRIWKNKRHVLRMLVYGVIGIAGCQMTYYLAVEDSNAGIATVLQYTAPVMIMVLLALKNWKFPEKNEILALILAFGGTVLLATHGNLTQLSVSKTTLIFGLSSAVATIFYNLVPGNLMDIYGTFPMVGWGMLISGIGLTPIVKPWTMNAAITWDWQCIACVAVVIVLGTVMSFSCYMEGVRLIGGSKASLLASVEPLTATALSVIFMHVAFSAMDLAGFVGIIAAVISSIIYVSYNLIMSFSILPALGTACKSKGEIRVTCVLSGVIIGILGYIIYLALLVNYDKIQGVEIPIATLAGTTNGLLYGFMFLLAVLSTAVGALYGVYARVEKNNWKFGFICFTAYLFSLAGFSNLVSGLYFYMGVAGIFLIAMLIIGHNKSRAFKKGV